MTDALVLGVCFSSFISVPSQVLYDGILALQIISHIPLNNFNLPGASLSFMKYLNQIVGFRKYDPYEYISVNFSITPPINSSFDWLGYSSMNFLENLSMVTFLFLFVVIRQIFGFLFFLLSKKKLCKCLKTK